MPPLAVETARRGRAWCRRWRRDRRWRSVLNGALFRQAENIEPDPFLPKIHRQPFGQQSFVRFITHFFDVSVFAFQGGEPTLAGLPFFEKLVEFQQQYGEIFWRYRSGASIARRAEKTRAACTKTLVVTPSACTTLS